MADENLLRIVEGLTAFKFAVEDKMALDMSLKEKMLQTMRPEEIQALQEKAILLAQEMMESLFTGQEPSDGFLKKNVELMNEVTGVALRVLPKEEVAACMPAGLRNQADAELLSSLGANTLSELCAFDLEAKPAAPAPAKKPKIKPKTTF